MGIFWVACLSIALSVAAQFCLKAGMSATAVKSSLGQGFGLHTWWAVFSQPTIVLGFALYGLGAVVWLYVLSRWDVSKAYPLVGLGFVGSLVIGGILGEQIGASRILGVVLIVAGVGIVGRS